MLVLPSGTPRISYAQLLRKRNTDNPVQISPRRYVNWRAPGVAFNHSCDPNTGLTSYPHLSYVALRDIAKGEELCWDYSTTMDKETICEFPCGCGAKHCRKTIKGFYWLPKKLQARYAKLAVVQRYLFAEK
jgi:hypothetical protein